MARRDIDQIHCLGDLVGYGPDPNGVIDRIRDESIPSLMGNYDDGVGWERGNCGCFYATEEMKQIGEASYAFTVAQVTADRKDFLRALPREAHLTLDGIRLHLVHGSPRKINEYLLRDRDERTFKRLAAFETDSALAFGHTHQSWSRVIDGVQFVNVGSVGRPKDGDPRAMYTVLWPARRSSGLGPAAIEAGEPLVVESVRVSYEVEWAARAVEAAGLPVQLAHALRSGR